MKVFNCIIYNPNKREFGAYNVIPYFVNVYDRLIERRKEEGIKDDEEVNDYWKVPVTHEDFVNFVERHGMSQFWSRCEYEVILSPWPPTENGEDDKKIDIWWQINLNKELIAKLVEQAIKEDRDED